MTIFAVALFVILVLGAGYYQKVGERTAIPKNSDRSSTIIASQSEPIAMEEEKTQHQVAERLVVHTLTPIHMSYSTKDDSSLSSRAAAARLRSSWMLWE